MKAYECAPVRVRQYLDAEIAHVCDKIKPNDTVLELGCGYGRILPMLAQKAKLAYGIDTSLSSLILAKETLAIYSNISMLNLNAVQLSFRDHTFDMTICVQNGISAFHVNQKDLIRESIRVTKPGGIILYSTYSEKFWNDRLEWFERQSQEGLLGEIDYERTGNGNIVCKDGFTTTTVNPAQFIELMNGIDIDWRLEEIDQSSLFCEMTKNNL